MNHKLVEKNIEIFVCAKENSRSFLGLSLKIYFENWQKKVETAENGSLMKFSSLEIFPKSFVCSDRSQTVIL